MKSVTLCLDPGHGGGEKGAEHNGIIESGYNLGFAKRCQYHFWKLYPYTDVVLTRYHSVHLSLNRRGGIVKDLKPQLAISIHVNATVSPDLHGAMAFYLPHQRQQSIRTWRVCDAFLRAVPFPLRRKRERPRSALDSGKVQDEWLQRPRNVLESLQQPETDAVLFELAYCSNPEDAKHLQDYTIQSALATAVQSAFDAWLISRYAG